MKIWFSFILSLSSLFLISQETKWVSKYNKNGLKVSIRGERTNEYKAEIIVDAGLNSCLSLMQDVDSHTQFMGAVKTIAILKQYPNQKFLMRTVIGMPFPMKDKELISEAQFKVLPNQKSVKVELAAKPYAHPVGKMDRMTVADGFWLFEKIDDLKTKITYQLKFEESNAPNWIVNYFVLDTPVKTLSGFAKFVTKEKYKSGTVKWL
jgi:ribosome-associated toxin RatA of RatAB toxin-antitoxin module